MEEVLALQASKGCVKTRFTASRATSRIINVFLKFYQWMLMEGILNDCLQRLQTELMQVELAQEANIGRPIARFIT